MDNRIRPFSIIVWFMYKMIQCIERRRGDSVSLYSCIFEAIGLIQFNFGSKAKEKLVEWMILSMESKILNFPRSMS